MSTEEDRPADLIMSLMNIYKMSVKRLSLITQTHSDGDSAEWVNEVGQWNRTRAPK